MGRLADLAIPQGRTLRKGRGINQVAEVVASLKDNPGSRRHIIEGWNVAQIDRMALPPCHKTYQYHVSGRAMDARLNGMLYQRSCDVALGLPFNLWSAALLQRMMAQQADLLPGELVWMGGDTHLYLNHADLIEEQLGREPRGRPTLEITRRRKRYSTTGSRISWCRATRRTNLSRLRWRSDARIEGIA